MIKFTPQDITALKNAISAARLVGVDAFVIRDGKVSGVSEKMNGCIFSDFSFTDNHDIKIGLNRLSELDKRLSLFGDSIDVTLDVTSEGKAKIMHIKTASGRVEFRCTDPKMIKAPTEITDPVVAVGVMSKAEVSQIVRGVNVLSSEKIMMHIDRNQIIRFEAKDSTNDTFEFKLENPAEFIDEATPMLTSFDGAGGVIAKLLDASSKECDPVTFSISQTGQLRVTYNSYELIAIPKIDTY
jgi:hypothetical protein